MSQETGYQMYELARKLFPICRSITGNGVRKSLELLLSEGLPLKIYEIPTGTRCFDWTVPQEWNVNDAYILDPSGEKIIDFKKNNLHLVGYSEPIEAEMNLDELQRHLHSLPNQPNAIPYITSYYNRTWGFCLTHEQRQKLREGQYKVKVDSSLTDGSLTYGELLIPGATEKEVLFSTYSCHPSMANNEVSGPVVATFLAKSLIEQEQRRYSYRFFIGPETIGPIAYLSRNLEVIKSRVEAGFVLTCVGDNRSYSFVPSRKGETLADRVALHALKHLAPNFKKYSFLDRGSDERQYCSPRVDLPVVSINRTKYYEYPEYHTSLDDLSLISPEGLLGAYSVYMSCIRILEANRKYMATFPCEPQLGKRGLYPNVSTKQSRAQIRVLSDLLAHADGASDLIDIADKIGVQVEDLIPLVNALKEHQLLTPASP